MQQVVLLRHGSAVIFGNITKRQRTNPRETGMIKVGVFYPYSDGAKFDMNYYVSKHMPMAREKFGSACKGMGIEQGVAGGAPGSPPAFVAM